MYIYWHFDTITQTGIKKQIWCNSDGYFNIIPHTTIMICFCGLGRYNSEYM